MAHTKKVRLIRQPTKTLTAYKRLKQKFDQLLRRMGLRPKKEGDELLHTTTESKRHRLMEKYKNEANVSESKRRKLFSKKNITLALTMATLLFQAYAAYELKKMLQTKIDDAKENTNNENVAVSGSITGSGTVPGTKKKTSHSASFISKISKYISHKRKTNNTKTPNQFTQQQEQVLTTVLNKVKNAKNTLEKNQKKTDDQFKILKDELRLMHDELRRAKIDAYNAQQNANTVMKDFKHATIVAQEEMKLQLSNALEELRGANAKKKQTLDDIKQTQAALADAGKKAAEQNTKFQTDYSQKMNTLFQQITEEVAVVTQKVLCAEKNEKEAQKAAEKAQQNAEQAQKAAEQAQKAAEQASQNQATRDQAAQAAQKAAQAAQEAEQATQEAKQAAQKAEQEAKQQQAAEQVAKATQQAAQKAAHEVVQKAIKATQTRKATQKAAKAAHEAAEAAQATINQTRKARINRLTHKRQQQNELLAHKISKDIISQKNFFNKNPKNKKKKVPVPDHETLMKDILQYWKDKGVIQEDPIALKRLYDLKVRHGQESLQKAQELWDDTKT